MKRITKATIVAAALITGGAGLAVAHGPGGGFGHGHHGPFSGRHIDGKIAFVKAELKITPEQEPQWQAVEAAVRASTDRMKEVRKSFRGDREARQDGDREAKRDRKRQASPAPERLARMEAAATAGVESLRTIRTAFEPLYASMSDEQKQRADELLSRRGRH